MLAGFANMGALYKHNPYSTIADEWNAYPWVLGWDNRFDVSVSSEFKSTKTRWDGIGSLLNEDSQNTAMAANVQVAMSATLIRFDMWGNVGSDTNNNDPATIPDEWLIVVASAPITNIVAEQTFFPNYFDSNSESSIELDGNAIVVASAPITNIVAEQTFFPNYFDANSESSTELDGNAIVVASAPITNISTS